MERSLGYVAHGGTYLLLGIVLGTIALADPELHKKEVTLAASRNATSEDFDTVLAAIRSGQVPMAALATHRAPLAEVPEQFPTWLRPDAGVVKALIEISKARPLSCSQRLADIATSNEGKRPRLTARLSSTAGGVTVGSRSRWFPTRCHGL